VLPRDRAQRTSAKGLRTFLVLALISLVLILGANLSPVVALRALLGSVARSASEPVAGVGQGVAGMAAGFSDAQRLVEDLATAAADRDRYAAEATRVASLEREVAELQAVLDLRASTAFDTVAVQVLARDFSLARRVVVIDGGAAAGVGVGDVVIGAGGTLVGRVITVSQNSAEVRLITDPEFTVTAEVASTGAIGILHGRGASALVLQDVAAGWDVPIGAEVTTSGIELSASIRSIFPRGLSIGRVIAVTSLDSSVLQTADIQPILNTETARVLLVIVNYDGGLPIPSAAP